MGRVIGMDIHRTFAEVVFWEAGRLRPAGRVDMTKAGLEGFGRTLSKQDEVVVEATGNAMAVVRALEPHVARVIVANSELRGRADTSSRSTTSWARRPTSCPRSGWPTPRPSACGARSRDATKSSGTAPGSRTRCMQSWRRT